jgi:hypothetical protein
MNSHSAVAAFWLKKEMHALLKIAGQVQKSGTAVTGEAISEAKRLGATDLEIHDTVLISAAFCMYNRYVDGLGTWCMEKAEDYAPIGELLGNVGYVGSMAAQR